MNDIDHLNHLRSTVLAAGARWVGVQGDMGGHDLVLFQSAQTLSTLALPDDEFFTVQSIQERVEKSDKKFEHAPIKVPRYILRNIKEDLEMISGQIHQYIQEEK